MESYEDYCMTPPGAAQPVAGICHARGHNADLPPVWLIYITVADLDETMRRCQARWPGYSAAFRPGWAS